jgi:DNA (cytosine-5)-methyltransferase 1
MNTGHQQSIFDLPQLEKPRFSAVHVERVVIRVLNLYAGIGGNRKLWENVDVTAVEFDPGIAEIYQDHFPKDTVIVGDAHQYLLEHYKEYDFIWASPPCPTHSRIREMGVKKGLYPALYPDIKLWQEVTLLKHFATCKWVVENVKPYYQPIVAPTFELDRHCFWSNFYVPGSTFKGRGVDHKQINGGNHNIYGFDISGYKIPDKRRLLRNMVSPEVGAHILEYV